MVVEGMSKLEYGCAGSESGAKTGGTKPCRGQQEKVMGTVGRTAWLSGDGGKRV